MSDSVIWKYSIPVQNEAMIGMPEGAKIVHVDVQVAGASGTRVCLWAQVDPAKAEMLTKRRFYGAATGGQIPNPENKEHIGTVLLNGGAFVWHVFEVR